MHFDGSKQHQGSGAGVTLKSPTGEELQYVLQIHFEATNNMAEYEALLHGLRIAKEIGIKHIICCGDSDLVAQQVAGTWNARNSVMAAYRDEVDEIAKCFLGYEVMYARIDDNTTVDMLSKLRSGRKPIPPGTFLEHLRIPLVKGANPKNPDVAVSSAKEVMAIILAWTQPFLDYLIDRRLPEDEVLAQNRINLLLLLSRRRARFIFILCLFTFRFLGRRGDTTLIIIILNFFCRRSGTILGFVLRTGPGNLAFVAGSDGSRFLFSLLGIFCFEGFVGGKHHLIVKFVVANAARNSGGVFLLHHAVAITTPAARPSSLSSRAGASPTTSSPSVSTYPPPFPFSTKAAVGQKPHRRCHRSPAPHHLCQARAAPKPPGGPPRLADHPRPRNRPRALPVDGNFAVLPPRPPRRGSSPSPLLFLFDREGFGEHTVTLNPFLLCYLSSPLLPTVMLFFPGAVAPRRRLSGDPLHAPPPPSGPALHATHPRALPGVYCNAGAHHAAPRRSPPCTASSTWSAKCAWLPRPHATSSATRRPHRHAGPNRQRLGLCTALVRKFPQIQISDLFYTAP
ncbi:hypothetical protein QYE76_066066 [Lolium multiflorum]|uniref:RNase H type-1 domain-containing protein n=1 Tax=Lolium multiflorum TaxID=4521 RepID=A0AAD8S9R0_LOLMU|nr:hypothetical protein QYE76_066066 [Lolium multiflorum]